MRTTDVNAFKGEVKNAIHKWLGHKVDEMFPNKPQIRVVAKNAINNGMNRIDDKINGYVDSLFLLFGDESGTIDSTTLVDGVAGLLDEMDSSEFPIGPFKAVVGKGEIAVHFPHNAFIGMFTGDLGGFKFTSSDIKEMKNYFNV
jgi:hypothetical protein